MALQIEIEPFKILTKKRTVTKLIFYFIKYIQNVWKAIYLFFFSASCLNRFRSELRTYVTVYRMN